MKYLFFIFNLILFYNYSSFADENVNLYSKTGDKLTITLPSGYCDITNTQAGKFLKDHLKRTLGLSGMPMIPKIIYRQCKNLNNAYPWGYTAIYDQKLPKSFTQDILFELSSKGLEDKKLTSSIMNDVNQSHKDFDVDVEIGSLGKSNILWQDENALIFYTTAKSKVNNDDLIEVVTSSLMLYQQYPIYNYIFEKHGNANPLKNAQLYLKSAKIIKGK